MNWFLLVGIVSSLIMGGISLAAASGSTYRYSFFFLSALLWAVYALRKRLALHPLAFALFASALLVHNLGAWGLYRQKIAGLEFDFYVHTYFGFVLALIIYRGTEARLQLHGWRCWLATLICVLGLGAIHELMEFSTNLVLGPEKGMLKPDAGPFDTQEDLAHNAFGAIIAMSLYAFIRRKRA